MFDNSDGFNVSSSSSSLVEISSCDEWTMIGSLSLILLTISLPFNSLFIWTVLKNDSVRTPINYLIIFLAANNLAGTLTQFPLLIANGLNCEFLFSTSVCNFMAISLFFTATMNNLLLEIVSIERYIVICKPFKKSFFHDNRLLILILVAVSLSTIFAFGPLVVVEWSRYVHEGIGVSCVVDTYNLSYGQPLFILVYITPIIIFVYTNRAIIRTVRSSSNRLVHNHVVIRGNLKKQRHIVILTVILVVSFFASNIPIMIIQTVQAFIRIRPIYVSLGYLTTRTVFVWPLIFYTFMNKDIKGKLACLSVKRTNQVTPQQRNS